MQNDALHNSMAHMCSWLQPKVKFPNMHLIVKQHISNAKFASMLRTDDDVYVMRIRSFATNEQKQGREIIQVSITLHDAYFSNAKEMSA